MTEQQDRDVVLDALADAFAAIEAAAGYAFDFGAAGQAAADRLAHLDGPRARLVAAALAAFVAMELHPRSGVGLTRWAEDWQLLVAMRGRDR